MNEPEFEYKITETKLKRYVYEVLMVSKDDDLDYTWHKGIYQDKADAKAKKTSLKKKKSNMYVYIEKRRLK